MEAPFNKEFVYELGKKYIIDNNEPIESCKNGFHYFNNTNNLFNIFDDDESFFNDKYRIFEIIPDGNVIEDGNICCCSEITLTKELSFEDLIDYDRTGKYIYNYALHNNNKKIDISKLEDLVIEKDKILYWCYIFACDVKGANINKLEDIVIEKDNNNGYWCYRFARDVKGANINKLEDIVIEKDITGCWCYRFACDVKGANIQKFENAVIKKDKIGKCCYLFARDIKGANIQKLEAAIIEKDKSGELQEALKNKKY
jgi:hypothetical protein